jgi:radical SAM superfamily enzyme
MLKEYSVIERIWYHKKETSVIERIWCHKKETIINAIERLEIFDRSAGDSSLKTK